ncbi:hypothetical protein ACFL20_11395 [Spirochaetota bacterium]
MKGIIKQYFLISLIALSCISFLSNLQDGFCRGKKKALVLGFNSGLINDIQDRLLRETLLRELKRQGYSIVPVMLFESVFSKRGSPNIRNINNKTIRKYCKKFKARFAISGKIYPKNKSALIKTIVKNEKYVCEINLYNYKSDKFISMVIEVNGMKDLYDFSKSLSKRIVLSVKSALKGSEY